MSDRAVIYGCAFARATTTAFVGVTIGVHLARIGLSPWSVGIVVTSGLAGAAVLALATTLFGDRVGRRVLLVAFALASALGSALFALASHPILLAAAAFVGGLNGMGRDRGGALVLEQAALPALVSDADRTKTIAIYTMLQDVGHAVGSLAAGLPGLVAGDAASRPNVGFLACGGVGLVAAAAYTRLGTVVEAGRAPRHTISRESRRILVRISLLFGIDSIGGGFLTTAMLSFFFFERFGASPQAIALLFFAARILNAASQMGAAWLAKRIGLVNTMVLTHMPSSVLLATAAIAPTFPIAAALFLLREGLVEMDVPTRQSYVVAVVAPEERTFASGATNLVRLAGWAIAPGVAGLLAQGTSLAVPLVVGAAIKIVYDLLLWAAFRRARPPEEQ